MERQIGNPSVLRGSAAEFTDFERVLAIATSAGRIAALAEGRLFPRMGQPTPVWHGFDLLRGNVSRALEDTSAGSLEVTYRGSQHGAPDVVDMAVGIAAEQSAIHQALTGQAPEIAPVIAQLTTDLEVRGLRGPSDLLR